MRHLGIFSLNEPHVRNVGRVIGFAALVGMVAGLGAIAFHFLTEAVAAGALHWLVGYNAGSPKGEGHFFKALFEHRAMIPWLLILVPGVGGLVSGWLVYKFAPEAEGHGTDAAIDSYHNKRGVIRPRVPMVKMLASAITLGTGGSAGREGPIAQIGAGFGSFLAQKLKLSVAEHRILMISGLGAGIAAIFHAPLAGAIFAIEVLYRDPDMEGEGLIPAFISCAIAYSMFSLVLMVTIGFDAFGPLFAVVDGITFNDPTLLLPLALLAMLMVVASWVYVKCFYGLESFFKGLKIPNTFKPAIGGVATGLFGVVGYYLFRYLIDDASGMGALAVLGSGYGYLQEILTLQVHPETVLWPLIAVMLFVGLGKILTTSFTISSGGSGGVFGPSMVIGGALGAVIGLIFYRLTPEVVQSSDVVIFAILGMAGFFAAAANTPVSTLIMVSELTGNYELLLPSMWVCALSYLLARGWTIYREQVRNRVESPAHRGDFIVDVLEGLKVNDALRPISKKITQVPLAMPLDDVVHLIADTLQSSFPVVDHDGKYYGTFGLSDVRQFLYESDLGALAVAQDLAQTDVQPLSSNADLGEAVMRFGTVSYEELPVSDPEDDRQIIGLLRRQDVIAAYNQRLLQMRSDEEK